MTATILIEGQKAEQPDVRWDLLRRSVRRLSRNTGAAIGVAMLVLLLLIAMLGNLASPYDPIKVDPADHFLPPSSDHLFGTDEMGRDVFSRVLAGAQVSVRVVGIVLLVAALLGVPLGAIAGYFGSPVDDLIMRTADIFLAFPSFILAMAIAASLGRSLENAILAVGIVSWPVYARLIRSQVLAVKNEPFVEAARAVGARESRVLFIHILPNCLAPFLIQLSMNAGGAILATAGLGFIGMGAQPPTPEWGAMVSNGRQYITTHWWIPTFPGLAISFAVTAYMFLGDGLRDLLDPRLKYLLGG